MKMDRFLKMHDDIERVIENDTCDSATKDSAGSSSEEKEIKSFRERVNYIIHTNKFQFGIIALVILDCFLVIIELILDLKVFELPEHASHVAPKVIHYCSIGILSVFMVEIVFRAYALRLGFFKHKAEMFDSFVVIISFVLDIVFRNHTGAGNGIGLLIVLRLWRVARIMNGIILSVTLREGKKLKLERDLRLAVEEDLAKFREYCAELEQEIESLKALLQEHNIDFVEKQRKSPVTSVSHVVADVNEHLPSLDSACDKPSEISSEKT